MRASLELEETVRCEWQVTVPDDLTVTADREQMFRALSNLTRNSTEVMPEGGCLKIDAARSNGGIHIDVHDDGPGLSEKARAHLFEAFAGGARAGGTGLGLAIVRDIMHAHGGEVELLESGAEGTTFRLRLPDR